MYACNAFDLISSRITKKYAHFRDPMTYINDSRAQMHSVVLSCLSIHKSRREPCPCDPI